MANHGYHQGVYEPLNKNKYKGTYPIIYRSYLELRLFRWFDDNQRILEWTSESVVIPYKSPVDEKVHRYFVDFSFKFKDSEGKVVHYLAEAKPHKFTLKPEKTKNKKPKTFLTESYNYAVNMAKWDAATQYSNKHGYKFIIITEKDLGL